MDCIRHTIPRAGEVQRTLFAFWSRETTVHQDRLSAWAGCRWVKLDLGPDGYGRAAEYAGLLSTAQLRGEGSTPVPLPPPACPRPRIRWVNSCANSPVTAAISHLSSGLPIGRAGLLFSERPSPKLWTPSIRYGSRNSNVWGYL